MTTTETFTSRGEAKDRAQKLRAQGHHACVYSQSVETSARDNRGRVLGRTLFYVAFSNKGFRRVPNVVRLDAGGLMNELDRMKDPVKQEEVALSPTTEQAAPTPAETVAREHEASERELES